MNMERVFSNLKKIKKHGKKVLATVLAAAMVTGMLNGVQIVNAAENTADFSMRAGASIRTSANTGIRFAVEIKGDVKTQLFNDDNSLKEDVEVGMIVVPEAILTEVSNTEGADYFEAIKNTYGKDKNNIATVFSNSQFTSENGKLVATAAIVNIKEVNYTRNYQAVAYYTTDGGNTYTYTAKSDARSIGYVADRALDDTNDHSSDKAVVIGKLLSKYILVNRSNDMSCEILNGQSINLYDTYAAGLENAEQFQFTVENDADNVSLTNNTLKAVKEGLATVLMSGYDGLVNYKIQVTTGKNYKASFTGVSVHTGNDNVAGSVYTREQLDSYEGNIPLTIGGRVAQLKASYTFTEENWSQDKVISVYGQMNMTKTRVKELLDAGYSYLVIPYYLVSDCTTNPAICAGAYEGWSTATKNVWTELKVDLNIVYENYNRFNFDGNGEHFFIRLTTYSIGTYEIYIGDCEVTTTASVPAPEKTPAEKVVSLIDKLPNADRLTLDDKADVEAAMTAYDAPEEAEKAEVTNADKLNSCVTKIQELEASKESEVDAKLSGIGFDAWSNNTQFWIGSNGDNANRLSATAIDNYQGQAAFVHATINHKADGSSDLFKVNSDDMFYTSHATYGITKDKVNEWVKAGYTKLSVNYYLTGDGDATIWAAYEGKYNGSWDKYLNVEAVKNQWSTFEIKLSDVLIQLDENTNSGYFVRLQPKSTGRYDFYLGTAKAIKSAIDTDAKLSGIGFDAWSGSAGLWIGSNGGYAERLAVESVDSFEGQSAFAHVTINHKFDGSSNNFATNSNDMFYTSYATLGVTEEEVRAWIAAGYSKLQVNYYYKGDKDLKIYANYEGAVKNQSWAEYLSLNAEKNKWSTFEIALEDVLYKYDESSKTALSYLFKLLPSEAGKYEFYIGSGKAVVGTENTKARAITKSTATTDWSMFRNLASTYCGIKGEQALGVESNKTESTTGKVASYRTGGTIDEKYAKGGSIKLYTPLAVKKSDIQTWIAAGYDKLEVPYFVESDNNYGLHVYAMDEEQYSQSVCPGTWNVARLDMEYIYKNFDSICEASGDNYLLRVELKKAGTYAIYLGDCRPVADAAVKLNDAKCIGDIYDGTVEYEVSVSDYVKDNLMIDNQAAYWKSAVINATSSAISADPYIKIKMTPDFSKAKVEQWIDDGYTSISLPYYIKGNGNVTFIEGIEWTWSQGATTGSWSTVNIPLSYIKDNYNDFGTNNWAFALYVVSAGEYEIYFGEGEVVAEGIAVQQNAVQLVNPGTIYYWGSDGECSGSYTTNVLVADRIAESYATITTPGMAGVISYYYTLNFDKTQILAWIDAGYTHFKIPYYLEGKVSHIYGQYDETYEKELHWQNYMYAKAQTNVWAECSISLENLLIRYDAIQEPGGEKYLFRVQPSESGTVKLAIGQCGVYKEAAEENKAVVTYTDTKTVTSTNIVTSGAANYEILIPKNAGSYVKTAAEELQYFIKESTGATLDIVTTATKNYISVGNTKELSNAGLSVKKEVKGTEGFQINTVNGNVYIYAAKDLGLVYGVYGYLERTLNYDYFYKDVFTINKDITAKLYNLDVTDIPDFATRVASYSVTDENGWLYNSKERLRIRMETYTENMTGALGLNDKGVEVAYSFHNSLNYLPEGEYGTDNPSWYYKVGKDEETKTQLCYNAGGNAASREKMENIVAREMFETLTKSKYANYDKIVFACEDNTEWCTCEACKADLASYGAKSASVVRFCNNVAVKVEKMLRAAKDSRAETFKLVFYAYNAVEDAPVLTSTDEEGNVSYSYRPEMKLNYHVTPLYAPIEADFSRSFKAETNKTYYESLKKWNMIANEVYMEAYDSFFNNRGYLLPYNSWGSLQSLYQTAYENGVTWMYNLGQENNSASSGFSLLKAYLESKLSWDVNADVDALTDKFFAAMYGEQATAVKGVYNSIKTHMNNLTAENFWPQVNSTDRNNDGHFKKKNWPKTTLTGWLSSLQTAENELETAGNTEAAKRVRLEEMNILSLIMETQYVLIDRTDNTRSYNTLSSDFKTCRKKFGDIVTEWKITNGSENDWSMTYYLDRLGYN